MKIWQIIRKHLKVYKVFFWNCLQAQLEYRVNFLFAMLTELGWVGSHLLYLLVLYQSDFLVNGLPKESLFLFVGSYLITTGIYMSLFFTNFSNFPDYMKTGQLDLFITKPVSLQFISTLRYVDFGYPLADFVVGVVLIVIGWWKAEISFHVITVLGFLFFSVLGGIWVYCIQIFPALLSFWTIKAEGAYAISYAVYDMNKMPRAVYGNGIQRIGTFLFPLFPMANYATLFVLEKLETTELVWGVVGPFLFLGITRFLWQLSMKKYTSATG